MIPPERVSAPSKGGREAVLDSLPSYGGPSYREPKGDVLVKPPEVLGTHFS